MPSTPNLVAVLTLAVVVLALRRLGPSAGTWSAVWLRGPLLPIMAGLTTGLVTAWIWGGLNQLPLWYDEAAYILQAELLAGGRFAAEAPPVPEAFAQSAIIVTPVLAPKMPPGHALMLVPGVILGLPGLMPVLLTALTGTMLVILARRIAGPAVALLSLVIWWTQGGQQKWRASYLTESTTALLWLVGWWCLLRWREKHERRWLLMLAGSVGFAAITRPLTTLLFAIPVGCVVFLDAQRSRRWRDVMLAAAVGAMFLLALPLQNAATLGDWRTSPLGLYTRQYMPFDRLGFGLDSTPPTLGLPHDLELAVAPLRVMHDVHQPARLPAILAGRLVPLYRSLFGGWRRVLIPAAVVGIVILPAIVWFGMLSAVLLYLGYLFYAHEPQWIPYYVEPTPVFAITVALGLAAIIERLMRRRPAPWPAILGVTVVMLIPGVVDFCWTQKFRRAAQAPFSALAKAVDSGPDEARLVFIPPDPSGDPHLGLVRNVANRDEAGVLYVHDLGAVLNREVRAAFPDRTAYRYDTATGTLKPLENP